MFIHCKLVILILLLTLDGQVHTGEIVGGHEAVPHSRPYMVLLERHMQNGKTQHCCGFLLNEDFVMTAAHCHAKSYAVLLGVHDVHNSGEIQRVTVKQTFPRKDYNATDYKNDIMLLKLSSKAKFSENVKPIPLAGQDDGSLPKSCILSGWGTTDRVEKYMSLVLMETNVTLIDSELCRKENSYCSEGKTGPGEGDSGGPLVCEDGKVYGVVSSSSTPNASGWSIYSYAKIPDYRSWIISIMEHNGKL
ncbi:granzyme B-like [Siniperca chuatsi]|uniref:granzyme B-like n=1 Tax=Siniperca chuatsi TaxID=119488 RepID=UPI001CE0EAC0|nr:granzyme B-like [Siniperca chuatsi]XP_044056128.1 granzyme B-like [Siniperca chuatsi]